LSTTACDPLAGRYGTLDVVKETDERRVAAPLHAAADTVVSSTLRAKNNVVVPWRL
jgi:hypothetical protein